MNMEMDNQEILAKIKAAGVHCEAYDRVWCRGWGCDMGEHLTGVFVETEADYFAAAQALGVSREVAEARLGEWSENHIPEEVCAYPIIASYEVRYFDDDDEVLDSGSFSIFPEI